MQYAWQSLVPETSGDREGKWQINNQKQEITIR